MYPQRDSVQNPQVQLMLTCLCDVFFDDVARAAVEILESLGCEVGFPEDQTCCGQPGYTAGDWEACRRVVRHLATVFTGDQPIVVPAGSCAAAVFHEAPQAFEGEPDLAEIVALGRRTWELTDFIVNGLGVTTWPGRLAGRVVIHPGCHNRGTPTLAATKQLLGSIGGLEILAPTEPEQCCGFGGVFSVAFPHVSGTLGRLKIETYTRLQPDFVVSPDMSCLLHQKGLARRAGVAFPIRHVAQVLRDAVAGSPAA
jgi:L-lactate dehydrogenase complex protein LldE